MVSCLRRSMDQSGTPIAECLVVCSRQYSIARYLFAIPLIAINCAVLLFDFSKPLRCPRPVQGSRHIRKSHRHHRCIQPREAVDLPKVFGMCGNVTVLFRGLAQESENAGKFDERGEERSRHLQYSDGVFVSTGASIDPGECAANTPARFRYPPQMRCSLLCVLLICSEKMIFGRLKILRFERFCTGLP
jgi:hypothetical protein